jgi:hypothetical protein
MFIFLLVERDTIMNRQNLEIHVRTGFTRSGLGIVRREIRSVTATRIWEWLADGVDIARSQPLVWVATILGTADIATALDLVAPFRLFALLFLAAFAGATILTPAGSNNANQWTIGQTFEVLRLHRGALFTVGLVCVAIVGAGSLLSFVLLNVGLTTAESLAQVLRAFSLAVATAAVWFAPALIVFRKLSPLDAMLTSLRAVFLNGPVALVYAAVFAADAWLAPLAPMLVRGLVLTPLTCALILLSMHGSYRDVLSIDRSEGANAAGNDSQ